jgi:repressor LexA
MMPRMALTRRQREIFDFVREFIEENGYSPSLEEIGARFGLSSVATVHKHVQHLTEKGYLKKASHRSRSVEPVESEAGPVISLPLLGSVAAGAPIEAIETAESIDVPQTLVPRRSRCFVLRVRGDSMIEEQIRDGDLVVIESRPEARDGETVVALIRGEDATLKRFYRRGARVRLEPANRTMRPIDVLAAEVEIRGVVRGLLRRY